MCIRDRVVSLPWIPSLASNSRPSNFGIFISHKIKSKVFFGRVLDSLEIETSYYSVGNVLTDEMYLRAPFQVAIKDRSVSILDKPIFINLEPNDSYTIRVDNQEKIWGAIGGLTDSFNDPYTVFLPPEDSAVFESDISGNFQGVGMEIGVREGILTVIAPLKGTPAEKAGVRAQDKILKIDDTPTTNINSDEAVKLIRGKQGTKVSLTILRDDVEDPIIIAVTRGVINIPTINTRILSDGIFVIELYNFSAISGDLFRTALREFVASRSNNLILDLRGNPGGYLEAAIDMTSWFLPLGEVVVREDFGGNREEVVHRSKGYSIFGKRLNMVILIDGGSASASEILAGALSEHGIATLVGSTSYGKGSVQELVKITQETSLKVTIARWLTPLGISISEGGLTPDIEVGRTFEDEGKGIDPQLQAAVEICLLYTSDAADE